VQREASSTFSEILDALEHARAIQDLLKETQTNVLLEFDCKDANHESMG
jgi:hypothetical protein